MMTLFAVPNMLIVPRLGNDPAGLRRALEGFMFWGDIRSAFQTLAFFANLWLLVVVSEYQKFRLTPDPNQQ
jgi:hypothetical protein